MPVLHVERHGSIPDEEVGKILAFLEECYGRLRPEGLDLVEIDIYENDSLWRNHMAAERRRAGVTSVDLDDSFIVTHDAWTGIPRISISLQRKENVTQLVWDAALRHEVGHSVLHGSLEYYVLPTPKVLMNAAQRFAKLASHLPDIVYLLALAVKDMEVTRLLFSAGYVEDQAAYARFVMKTTEQDLQAWDLSSLAAEARVLCLIGRLKDILPATVLASRPDVSDLVLQEVEESVEYLPQEPRRALIETVTKIANDADKDTFTNIQVAAAILATKIIEPLMTSSTPK
jgi:hypothetical protein